MEKKIWVKRAAPRNEADYSQQAQVIEQEPEKEFDHTKFALTRMMEINEKYRRAITTLTNIQGRITSLNNENQSMLDFIKFNVDLDED